MEVNEGNLIRQAFLLVIGDEERLVIQEVYTEENGNYDDHHRPNNPQGVALNIETEHIQALQCTIRGMRRNLRALRAEMLEKKAATERKLAKLLIGLN